MPTSPGLQLRPFRGLRYAPSRVRSLAAVTSPPYDVVVRPEGQHYLETADPHNIVRLILPPSPAAAAELLDRWLREGVLVPDERPAIYVYEQHKDDTFQRGLIGALKLSEPAEGIVLPHEGVMEHIVLERAALMRATAANPEPLLLSYAGDGNSTGATAVIERAAEQTPLLATTTEDGVEHRLWAVTDPAELAAIDADLSTRQALIADGHHRWATYLRLRDELPDPGPWNYGLVLLVDTARYPLQVKGIHRVLNQLPPATALTALDGLLRVREINGPVEHALDALSAAPADVPAFVLTDGATYHLIDRPDPALLSRTIPADRPAAWRGLDATVLHSTLLDHVWKVPDEPAHVGYLHDAEAAVAQVQRHGGTAILMRPVPEEVVRDLARAGVTMPRKSTSFGPKPATGLVLRSLPLG
ncbi:hypothetical protein SRB5_32790 [Streptomyces sp. RB5]|uniref:DUF1015 domain-containing protein n=1 Tax=Streptomyces smaragdinus TaxID=2585196 RepID=A0A7K0CI82_9ACTN|nr:DUF1015 domain-containing protein [Streptomyces smaragdinus]MQY13136.1 hypothetical protein [Streptomyces smaragdinus]